MWWLYQKLVLLHFYYPREDARDVQGEWCDRHWLSHETKFFLRACQLAYEGNDFGLCSNTLAIVDSDWRICVSWFGWLGTIFPAISCLSWLACSTDMLNMICTNRKVLSCQILLQPMPVLVREWITSQQCKWNVWLIVKISNERRRHVRNVKWRQSSGKRCSWLVGRSACVADNQNTR